MADSGPKQLTYLITGLQYGGANVGMLRLLSGLDPEEFDITVVSIVETSDDISESLPDHVTVRRLNVSGVTDISRLRKLVPMLQGTEVLVCSLFHASVVGVPIARLIGIPHILVWQHNTQPPGYHRYLAIKTVFRLADRVLADSERVQSYVRSVYRVPESKIAVLPIAGIDTETYHPLDMERNSDLTSVGSVGRLTPQKGFDDLLRCAQRLGSDFQFHIAGDGSERQRLETSAPENVTFHGTIANKTIPEFLNRNDIYFQPSKREGLCMTVIEAMSCGLPAVASDVGGIPESVIPGTTGYLCGSGDIACFSTHLEELGSNPELRKSMGTAGRDRVLDQYSQSVLIEKFEQVIQQIQIE